MSEWKGFQQLDRIGRERREEKKNKPGANTRIWVSGRVRIRDFALCCSRALRASVIVAQYQHIILYLV